MRRWASRIVAVLLAVGVALAATGASAPHPRPDAKSAGSSATLEGWSPGKVLGALAAPPNEAMTAGLVASEPSDTPSADPTGPAGPSPEPSDSPEPPAQPTDSPEPQAAPTDSPEPSPMASPSPSPSPTPTPTPVLTPPPRPRTLEAPVPTRILASLGRVWSDIPLPYYDGCHVSSGGRMPARWCFYGNLASRTTIALFGDSHALSWFPAVLRFAKDRGWRVLSLTMSACVPADIIPYYRRTGSVMTACQAWRKAAIARLVKLKPAIIIVTGTRGFATIDSHGRLLTGPARTAAWVAGMKRTLAKLIPAARRVYLMADTPISRFTSPASCIASHPRSTLACATPVSFAVNYLWLNTEYHTALAMRTGFINPERWVCPTSPCPAHVGYRVVWRNKGHLTASFTDVQWRRLKLTVMADLARTATPASP